MAIGSLSMIARILVAGLLVALMLAACGDAAPLVSTSELPAPPSTTAPVAGTTIVATTAGPETTPPPRTTMQTTSAPRADAIIDVQVIGGEVTAPDRPEVDVGSTVLLVVTADVTDEVHVHGYDYFLDLTPGATVDVTFVADIPGIFEIELEGSGLLLFELVVR